MDVPNINAGFWADVVHENKHLRLFSEMTAVGEVGAVFDVSAKAWISREWADNLDDGKHKAEQIAYHVLRSRPAIEWKKRA